MKWIISLVTLLALAFIATNISSFAAVKIERPLAETEFVNNPDGLLVEEFSDFQCPYCKRALPTINYIKAKYSGQINFQYKHYPLPSHSNAFPAAVASECARDQNNFWEYHDLLFLNQHSLAPANLITYAETLNLNVEQFIQCLNSDKHKEKVLKQMIEGKSRGVPGTPTFFVNKKQVYLDQLDNAIQQQLR